MTKSTITRERLLAIADDNAWVKCTHGEVQELARMALSAMDSKPVARCPYPCGWDTLNKLAIQDAAFVALALVAGEPATESIRRAVISNNDRLLKVISFCRDMMPQAGNSPANPGCWCRTCRPVDINDMRFVVCPECGNKRCPRANDHRNSCTGSNEPGQEGSAYPDTTQEPKP